MDFPIKRAKLLRNDGSFLLCNVGIDVHVLTFIRNFLAGDDDRVLSRIGLEYNGKRYNIIEMKDWFVDYKLHQQFNIILDDEFTGTSVEFF